jgi:lipopolysaccharide transport system ATP-binding protein
MHDIAIRVEGISKKYQIGRKQAKYRTLRDTLADAFVSPFRRARRLLRGQATGAAELDETIWALRDVSFEIKRGEVVGLIGRNGAGKSTLLKILSRITEPTAGFADVYGRVGSLLEVGTGFHQELTGRENIYLSGAILGMKRVEVDRKFDEIVDFSEVEKFIDTPVKHYSSGMYLRLAFAVAAHLDPEVLLVDEVLAVGDTRFRRKCLGKMEDVGQEGRTVLFVSHNMAAISRLCERTILVDEGRLIEDGPSHQVIRAYLNYGEGTMAAREWPDSAQAPGGDVARLRAVRVRTVDGRVAEAVDIRRPVRVEMEYEVLKSGHVLLPHFYFWNQEGVNVFGTLDLDPDWRSRPRPAGRYVSSVHIPGNFLSDGMLFVNAALGVVSNPYTPQFWERSVVAFEVVDSFGGDSARGDWTGSMGGAVRPLLQWDTEFTPGGDVAAEE